MAISADDNSREQVIARQSVFASELAEAAPKRQPGNAGVAVDAHSRCKTMNLSRGVELAQGKSGFGACYTTHGIDLDPLHAREINHNAVVAHRATGHIVTTAANRDEQFT
jgi:hypothetical protein